MRWIAAAALLSLGLNPCAASAAAGERETLRFEINQQNREVLLYAPSSVTALTPLIVIYHGRGDDAEPFARAVKLHRDWPEAVVAYPRGEWHENRPQRGWQYRAGQYEDRDLKLTDALLTELATRYPIAPTQRHAAGFSNGGHFLFLLLKQRPQEFASYTIIGAVQPKFESDAAPRPLLYLFGRGEDRHLQEEWQATVLSLIRHQRTGGDLLDALGCCKRQRVMAGGAPLVFGTYNAGHIWPADGNRWIKQFVADPWFLSSKAERKAR